MLTKKEMEDFRQDMLDDDSRDIKQEVEHEWKMRTDDTYALDFYADDLHNIQQQLEVVQDKLSQYGHSLSKCELIMQ